MRTEKNSRGLITEELSQKYSAFWQHDMTIRELRLVPYLVFCLVNRQPIDPLKINSEEREIISSLRNRGLLSGGASEPLACTKECWETFTEILWDSYVDKIISFQEDQQ